MRCPKCQYLGFDGQNRCRNCGYDFSLSQTLPPEAATSETESSVMAAGPEGEADLLMRPEPTARERARAAIQKRQAASRAGDPFDLPLFAGDASNAEPAAPRVEPRPPMPPRVEGRPFVSSSPTPRPPLSVRRATSEPARARAGAAVAPTHIDAPHAPPVEFSPADVAIDTAGQSPGTSTPFEVDELPISFAPATELATAEREPSPLRAEPSAPDAPSALEDGRSAPDESSRAASIRARLIGGLIDAVILGAIDLVVIAFTLRLTGVAWGEIGRLPLVPLAAFLALLATGYLAMFTVLAGQTAGQMVTGIRVVETNGRPVRFGHAVLRAAVQVATVPLLGLGFVPALISADRRTLYDRLSETEVVRSDD
jgi:uncharacterized RDD family membrane protein YckC